MAIDIDNSITTSLLTLLNVSATKAGKRKRTENDFVPAEKLNKRKSPRLADVEPTTSTDEDNTPVALVEDTTEDISDETCTEGMSFTFSYN